MAEETRDGIAKGDVRLLLPVTYGDVVLLTTVNEPDSAHADQFDEIGNSNDQKETQTIPNSTTTTSGIDTSR